MSINHNFKIRFKDQPVLSHESQVTSQESRLTKNHQNNIILINFFMFFKNKHVDSQILTELF